MKVRERPLERNIATFDADAAALGGYVYTAIDRWSTRYATGRQTEEIIRMLAKNFSSHVQVVDLGCGDGTYTLEIAERFRPAQVCGVDPAANAIDLARSRIPLQLSGVVSFNVGDIYKIETEVKPGAVAVLRGVLHHLDKPRDAIAALGKKFTSVISLEPNGFNPGMKIIEKVSKYHREHDEKSYWPPSLNHWFREQGFEVAFQKFFCTVPYFFPTLAAKALSLADPVVEAIPVVREICCGTNLVLYRMLAK
jgi:SAM-dependent methyltransferase